VGALDELRDGAHLQIAIDGPAGAGKSTVGRGVSAALGCPYLDTGLMYRAVTRAAQDHGVATGDAEGLARLAEELHFSWSPERPGRLLIDGRPAPPELHSPSVDADVSQVSAHPEVRSVLVRRQRELAESGCVVMVGRDIGTVVLPGAAVKLWVTASPEERARRRLTQHTVAGHSPAEVSDNLHARDRIDSGRIVSPAVPAKDAVVLDTDRLSADESVHLALDGIRRALERRAAPAS
jgi:CMP/dCMP kinase